MKFLGVRPRPVGAYYFAEVPPFKASVHAAAGGAYGVLLLKIDTIDVSIIATKNGSSLASVFSSLEKHAEKLVKAVRGCRPKVKMAKKPSKRKTARVSKRKTN